MIFCILFSFTVYFFKCLFLRERASENMNSGEAKREGDGGSEAGSVLLVGVEPMNHEIMT